MVEPVNTAKAWSLIGMQGFVNRTRRNRLLRKVGVVTLGAAFSAGVQRRQIYDVIARIALDAKYAKSALGGGSWFLILSGNCQVGESASSKGFNSLSCLNL
jgi:hypothetical protein